MKTIIHVNQHKIKSNAKNGTEEPVFTVKTYKSNDYAHEVAIDGPCVIRYSPDKPLSCGARAWIETRSKYIKMLTLANGTNVCMIRVIKENK